MGDTLRKKYSRKRVDRPLTRDPRSVTYRRPPPCDLPVTRLPQGTFRPGATPVLNNQPSTVLVRGLNPRIKIFFEKRQTPGGSFLFCIFFAFIFLSNSLLSHVQQELSVTDRGGKGALPPTGGKRVLEPTAIWVGIPATAFPLPPEYSRRVTWDAGTSVHLGRDAGWRGPACEGLSCSTT